MAANPLTVQGSLNRILVHTIIPSNPQLTVTAPYMSKTLAVLTFDGPFVNQIGTATGLVNSPEPYVMSQLVISLLRSQPLSALWVAQVQLQSMIGSVVVYSDSCVFPEITLANCSITDIDPGSYDGNDPTVKVTVKGVFYANAAMWVGATAGS